MKHNQNYLTQFKKKLSLIRYLICTNINLKTLLKKYKNRCKELYNELNENQMYYEVQNNSLRKELYKLKEEIKELKEENFELGSTIKMVLSKEKKNNDIAIHKEGKYNV